MTGVRQYPAIAAWYVHCYLECMFRPDDVIAIRDVVLGATIGAYQKKGEKEDVFHALKIIKKAPRRGAGPNIYVIGLLSLIHI